MFRLALGVSLAAASSTVTSCGGTRDVVRAQNRLDIARDLLGKGETVGAESEAKRALDHDPRSEEAENLLGLVHVLRAQQGTALIEKADCLSADDAAALRATADEHMRTAGKHFARASELAPDYGEAWANRAVVAMHFHDWDTAIEHGKRALGHLERLESAALTHANLGWAYHQKQDYVLAITELLQANQGPQYFCLGKYRLASVYFARKEFDKTAEALAPIFADASLCPPLQEAQYLGGQAYLRLRNHDAAQKAFSACVAMAPKSCQALECKKALAEVSP
jgi:tetratricopeptide (TPR) repeat protein